MSASRAKGTAFESAVVRYLNEHGFPYAERRALHGGADQGDITGTPGIAWECKNTRALDLAGAVDEAEAERRNAGAELGVAVIKRKGRGDAAHAYAVVPLSVMAQLLNAWKDTPA